MVVQSACIEPTAFITAIWSGEEWKTSWDQILDVIIDYDDGEHQALRLKINWQGEPVDLSVMRFRNSPTQVEFFCPCPPKELNRQVGTWSAETQADGNSILKATRNIVLARKWSEADVAYRYRSERYCEILRERLRLILLSFSIRMQRPC